MTFSFYSNYFLELVELLLVMEVILERLLAEDLFPAAEAAVEFVITDRRVPVVAFESVSGDVIGPAGELSGGPLEPDDLGPEVVPDLIFEFGAGSPGEDLSVRPVPSD